MRSVFFCSLEKNSGRKFFVSIALVLFIGFLGGCQLFQKSSDKTPVQREFAKDYISVERELYRRHNHRFVCLVVAKNEAFSHYDDELGDWTGPEIDVVRKIAKQLNMSVDFVGIDIFSVSSALRNGKGDVAIGQFTENEIVSMHMRPAMPYDLTTGTKSGLDAKGKDMPQQAQKKQKCYLMVRRGDTNWMPDPAQ